MGSVLQARMQGLRMESSRELTWSSVLTLDLSEEET